MTTRIIQGDCRDVLRTLADSSVHCCVTSPPYFGLRDYGNVAQIGLEPTPDAYIAEMVAVFREVKRVLRDDGTLWLNLGDSYAGSWGAQSREHAGKHAPNVSSLSANQVIAAQRRSSGAGSIPAGSGLKPKDLMGIPWRVAFALQQPYYTGNVSDERDRVWLAAMVDAEGSICGTEYQTGDRTKTNIYISVTNTSVPIIAKCERLFPQDVKHVYEKAGPSSRVCYRWDVECMETKALFLREIYPHLVAKRKQAIVGYTFIELQRGLFSKKKGYLPEQQEQRSWLMAALSRLNAGEDVDLPDWVVEPPPLFEPGFYLRQEIIWAKPNPMPESVRDRFTKSHEQVFLLAKSARYYFDSDAMQEPAVGANEHDLTGRTKQRLAGNVNPPKGQAAYEAGDELQRTKAGLLAYAQRQRSKGNRKTFRGGGVYTQGQSFNNHRVVENDSSGNEPNTLGTRNKRSVWTIATKPFAEAHFATMAPELAETCIRAGCPEGGTVLDPFGGAGTTALVAEQLGRHAVLCELSAEYIEIARRRIAGDAPLFADVSVTA